jgi:hypothetical protein
MDTLLALIIALGGIATGICAIWAALAARREGQACRVGRGLEMGLDTATFREFPFHALR